MSRVQYLRMQADYWRDIDAALARLFEECAERQEEQDAYPVLG